MPKQQLRNHAESIARSAIDAVRPDAAVRRALEQVLLTGRVYLVAVGKAAWQMAQAAVRAVPIHAGIVLTKYGHVMGPIPGVSCLEAGHPIPDENSYAGTQAILDMTAELTADDTVLFLLSGGGSALFEKPLVAPEVLQDLTAQLLASGADIVRMNTIRKRLSAVKGGRFALHCAPARIEAVILSDILGDPVDMIASGPAAPDPSTCGQALEILREHGLNITDDALECLKTETPKALHNVHTQIIGSVSQLCAAGAQAARKLGYEPILLTDRMDCLARDAGQWLAETLRIHANDGRKLAFIAGGETLVRLTGTGLGGRNQELALSAARGIAGIPNACLISVGSDGTDGPTDAAGGYVDGDSFSRLGDRYEPMLRNNDSYHALDAIGGLIKTGPTGTNVNDVTIGLLG